MNTNILQFNWFDFVILAVIFLSIIVSFFRGFLREAISLITWLIAIIVALKFAGPLGNELSSHIESASLRFIIAFVILFFGVLIAGLIVNLIIKLLVEKTGMGFFDRLLGGLFGAARGILLVAIVLMFLYVTKFQDETWLKQSKLTPHFQPLVSWLSSFVPKQINDVANWISDSKKIT